MSTNTSLRLRQEVTDTYRLALIGGYFYLAGWLVVAIYGKAFIHSSVIAWTITALLLALAVARRLHKIPAADTDEATHYKWLLRHWGIVFSTTALFGLIFLWTILDERLAAGHTAVSLSTMGLAVAIAHAFSMRLRFAILSVAMMYLPGLVALWLVSDDSASALVMTIYLIYVAATLWRSYHEYQDRLDIDQELRDQRDLFEQQGRVDALTELANRRHFTESLMRMSQHAKTTNDALILIMLDLDHFKNINDQYGHAVGDACLAIFSARLKGKFGRKNDQAARLGGEEFGILLQGVGFEVAMNRAHDFRAMCEREPISVGDTAIPITVSIGVVAFDYEIHRDGDGLYKAADSAVYRAKNAGRNRVCGQESEVT
ncbi:MAG: GGDEF domain-containing protein [Arenimonas sp.]